MIFKYCPDCGAKLGEKDIGDEGLIPFCEPCDKPRFSFSYSCVICLAVDDDDNAVLIKQSDFLRDIYVCVAGYVKHGETIENAACREVEEEIGLEVESVRYVKSYYLDRTDQLMFGFVCKVKKSGFHISKEVEKANWFKLEEAKNTLWNGSIAQKLVCDYMQMIEQH